MSDQIHAILFDLDGTLLDNDMDRFLPHYFRGELDRAMELLRQEEQICRELGNMDVEFRFLWERSAGCLPHTG